jgi:hypothetical protein
VHDRLPYRCGDSVCGFLALSAIVIYVGFFVILGIRLCACDMVCILW